MRAQYDLERAEYHIIITKEEIEDVIMKLEIARTKTASVDREKKLIKPRKLKRGKR